MLSRRLSPQAHCPSALSCRFVTPRTFKDRSPIRALNCEVVCYQGYSYPPFITRFVSPFNFGDVPCKAQCRRMNLERICGNATSQFAINTKSTLSSSRFEKYRERTVECHPVLNVYLHLGTANNERISDESLNPSRISEEIRCRSACI